MKTNVRPCNGRLICAVLIILLISCGKDKDIFTPDAPGGNIDEFFNETAEPIQEFLLDATNEIFFTTPKGSLIYIPAGTLVTSSGSAVTGEVTLQLKEIDKKYEMIREKATTMTDQDYLISEKMFLVKLFQREQQLRLKDGSEYQILVPNTIPDNNMRLFYGTENEDNLIWEEASTNQERIINEWFFETDKGVISDFGYVLNCDRFDWVNIDKYHEEGQNVHSVCIQLPTEIYNSVNTIAFMVIGNENSLVQLAFNATDQAFCEPYGEVPHGKEVTIVTISSLENSAYHYQSFTTSVEQNLSLQWIPEKMTLDEIKIKLKEL